MPPTRFAPVLLLTLVACAAQAHAQESNCLPASTRGYETFPGSGASRVALDAPVFVRMSEGWSKPPTKEKLQTALEIRPVNEVSEGPTLAGDVQWIGDDTLWFEPAKKFAPHMQYQVSLASWLTGADVTFTFTTGEEIDQGPPEFELGKNDVVVTSGPAPAECGLPSGSYLVELALLVNTDSSHPIDDADDGSVEYVAYLTRALNLSAPRYLARTRRTGQTEGPVLRFALSAEEAQGPVCVTIQAYDGVLNRAEAEPELCFDPVDSAYFHGMCTIALPQSLSIEGQRSWLAIFLIALVLILRRSMGRPATLR